MPIVCMPGKEASLRAYVFLPEVMKRFRLSSHVDRANRSSASSFSRQQTR